MVADIEELEQMDASEFHAKRLNAKDVLTPMSGEKFIFPNADGTVKTLWRRSGSENIHFNPGSPRLRRRKVATYLTKQSLEFGPSAVQHERTLVTRAL